MSLQLIHSPEPPAVAVAGARRFATGPTLNYRIHACVMLAGNKAADLLEAEAPAGIPGRSLCTSGRVDALLT